MQYKLQYLLLKNIAILLNEQFRLTDINIENYLKIFFS